MIVKRYLGLFALSILCLTMTFSCASTKHALSDLKGDYIQEGSSNTTLSLSKGRYVFAKPFEDAHINPFICCDTLSIGSWERTKDLNYLVLTSDFQSEYPLLNMEVIEENSDIQDSIYIHLNNPIEKFQIEMTGRRYNDIYYMLEVSSNDYEFDLQTSFLKFDTSLIVIRKPKGLEIKSFRIMAVPKQEMRVRNLEVREAYTQEYKVNSKETNRFKVSIPALDYSLISQLRLTQDFVRIVGPKQLEWDGKKYLKK